MAKKDRPLTANVYVNTAPTPANNAKVKKPSKRFQTPNQSKFELNPYQSPTIILQKKVFTQAKKNPLTPKNEGENKDIKNKNNFNRSSQSSMVPITAAIKHKETSQERVL